MWIVKNRAHTRPCDQFYDRLVLEPEMGSNPRLCLKLILHNTKENGVAKTKGTEIIVRRNMTMFPCF